jgi:hypothetical protein
MVHYSLNIIGWRAFPFENLELDSGFRRRDEYKKGIGFFVIPAQAGIQEDQKMKSMSRQLWPD